MANAHPFAMAKDPNRPAPDESPIRQDPPDVPQSDRERNERAPRSDADIETGRSERGRGNEGIE